MLTTTISFVQNPSRRVLMSYEVEGIVSCPFKEDQGLVIDSYGYMRVKHISTVAYPKMLVHRVIVNNSVTKAPEVFDEINAKSTERTDITVG